MCRRAGPWWLVVASCRKPILARGRSQAFVHCSRSRRGCLPIGVPVYQARHRGNAVRDGRSKRQAAAVVIQKVRGLPRPRGPSCVWQSKGLLADAVVFAFVGVRGPGQSRPSCTPFDHFAVRKTAQAVDQRPSSCRGAEARTRKNRARCSHAAARCRHSHPGTAARSLSAFAFCLRGVDGHKCPPRMCMLTTTVRIRLDLGVAEGVRVRCCVRAVYMHVAARGRVRVPRKSCVSRGPLVLSAPYLRLAFHRSRFHPQHVFRPCATRPGRHTRVMLETQEAAAISVQAAAAAAAWRNTYCVRTRPHRSSIARSALSLALAFLGAGRRRAAFQHYGKPGHEVPRLSPSPRPALPCDVAGHRAGAASPRRTRKARGGERRGRAPA